MAARAKKPAISTKASSSTITTTTTPVAHGETNPVNATNPVHSSSLPTFSTQSFYKERPGPAVTKAMSSAPATATVGDDPNHRPNQAYQGAASLRQIHQSPNLNASQSHQPPYAVHGAFSQQQPGLQSPYLNTHQQFQHPPPGEGAYYSSNPSPRSATSAAYYSTDKPDSMATATATMQRPYPQIYHTPQSNSPASATSPQPIDHGRPLYSQQPPQMQQHMYAYQGYQPMGAGPPTQYGGHQHPPQLNVQPMLPYQTNASPVPPGSMANQPTSIIASSPRVKVENIQHYGQSSQNQQSDVKQRYSASATPSNAPLQSGQAPAPPTTSNAAPGPIPATTPLVVKQDQNGVQWIAFEYSRDRVKMEYIIRCDVESVDASQLSQEFKGENCVYPRACVPKDQYKGNRLAYETDCNQVGWALAELNQCLRGKRGLIQRAVDSWRNSNQDPRLRSRRVRRQAKMNNRAKVGSLTSQPSASQGSVVGAVSANPMGGPAMRPLGKPQTSTQQGHHHGRHDISNAGQDSIGANPYATAPGMHRPSANPQHLTSPTDLRHASTFPAYHTYPTAPTTLGPSMAPPMPGQLPGYGRPGGSVTMRTGPQENVKNVELYGDLSDSKQRKFLLVEDTQNSNAKVRVKVTLDQVDMSEIPDSYRKQNSVFPRAYFPVHMQTATESTSGQRYAEDIEEMDDAPPTIGRATVPCQVLDGDAQVEVSRLSRARRDSEMKLNELGYRMAWGQSRVFANRPIFLGRALDVYRNKQCELLLSDQKSDQIPPHLVTRPGKRRWQHRVHAASPPGASPVPAISS